MSAEFDKNTEQQKPIEADLAEIRKTQVEHGAKLARILEILDPKPKPSGAFSSTDGIRVGNNPIPDQLPPVEGMTSENLGLP